MIKPEIFCDSAMDNPQSFAYLKLSKENRRSISATHDTTLLKKALSSSSIMSLKLGLHLNHNFIPDSMSRYLSSHVSLAHTSSGVTRAHLFLRYMTCFSSF
jgi:hypothetical protein